MKLKLFFFLLLGLFSESISAPQAIELSGDKSEYSLNPYIEIFIDSTQNLTIDKIISKKYSTQFNPSNNKTPNFGHTTNAVWIKFKIKKTNTDKDKLPWILETKFAHINYIDYYLFSNEGNIIDSIKTGNLRSVNSRYPLIFLNLSKQKEYTIYMRFESEASLTLPLYLYSTIAYLKQKRQENTINGLFIGIMAITLIINIFAFFALKDERYFYFSLSIISFLLYNISYSGLAAVYLWPNHLYWNYLSVPFFLILTSILFIKFTDSYLQAKIRMQKWHYTMIGVITINSILFILLAITNYHTVITPIIIFQLISLILIFLFIYISYKNGFQPARFFLISYVSLLIGVFVFSLVRFGVLPSIISTEIGMKLGSVAYVLLMSYALRNRIITMVKEKEETDKSLQLSEQKFRSIIETTRDIIWEVDHNGKYTYISPTINKILGFKPIEVIGKFVFDFMPEEEAKRIGKIFKNLVSARLPFIQLENVNISKDGKEVILESSGVPFFDHKNNLIGYRGIDRDITEKKRAIEEKEKSEQNLRALLNATMEVAFLIDSDYRIITGNDALAKLAQKNIDELHNKYTLDLLPPQIAEERKKKLDEAVKTRKAVRWEDGTKKMWWDNSIYPITDSNAKVTSLAVFSVDITKRKQAESVREVMLNIANAVFITKNTSELYKTIHDEINKLINAKNFFVALYNEEENIITMAYIVDEKDELTGIKIPLEKTLSAQVVLYKKAMLFTRQDMLELDRQGLTGSGYGTPSLSWLGVPLLDDNDKVIGVAVIQDYAVDNAFNNSELALMEFVSKQISMSIMKKQAEEKIHILSQSIEQNPTIIMITDTEGYIEYVNPRFTEITGYSYTEAIGKKPNILKSGETPESVYKELWQRITGGNDWKGEFHNKKKNGDFYWELTHITPIKNEEGNITHYLALKEDISEHKKLQQQVIQSQRMEAIGTLAGGIAHDFNNLLTVIKGFSEIALLKTTNTAPIHKDIQAILSASDRAEKLTKQILAFSRKQIYQPRILSINKIITELQGMIHRLIGEDISVELNLCDDLPMIKADPSQIEQILMNLIVNARDAINQLSNFSGQKKIIIHSRKVSLSEENIKDFEIPENNQYILFSVNDNGTGIADEVKQYVFDPFFTTKETGKGTGLGLATVYGIVKQNNGFVHFNSELGKGSEFIIYWPATNEEVQQKTIIESPESKLNGSETILLVEDDENLLKFAETVLLEFGYNVITATNGKKALETIENNAEIHLIITDFLMPDINGKELSNKVRAIKPQIDIIVTSGYEPEQISENDNINFLQKPFSVNRLLLKVREILDKK
jgi:PAS domain S-box-containing protein